MNLKYMTFKSPYELCQWVNNADNQVGAIQPPIFDASSGHYVLFYTTSIPETP